MDDFPQYYTDVANGLDMNIKILKMDKYPYAGELIPDSQLLKVYNKLDQFILERVYAIGEGFGLSHEQCEELGLKDRIIQSNFDDKINYYETTRQQIQEFIKIKNAVKVRSKKDYFLSIIEKNRYYNFDHNRVPKDLLKIRAYLQHIERLEGGFLFSIREKIINSPENKRYSVSDFSHKYITNFEIKDYDHLYKELKKVGNIIIRNEDLGILSKLNDLAKQRNMGEKYKTLYNNQPNHKWLTRAAFNNLESVITSEAPIFILNAENDEIFTGHIDLILIIGKNLYIVDYKPEYDFSLNPSGVSKIFADTIPQVASYALIFKEMFKTDIEAFGYNVLCYTFNENNGFIYKPYEALEAYTDFYEEFKPLEGAPPWKWLLDL